MLKNVQILLIFQQNFLHKLKSCENSVQVDEECEESGDK